MAVSDGRGKIAYRFVYDTYGELSDIKNGDGISLRTLEEAGDYTLEELAHAAGLTYLYNGQYGVATDKNGLYYMRARYYDQDIKRFVNRDIVSGDITNSKSLNRYAYVQGNPVSLTDPFGLCPDGNTQDEYEKFSAMYNEVKEYYKDMPWWERLLNGGYWGLAEDYYGYNVLGKEFGNLMLSALKSSRGSLHTDLAMLGIVFYPLSLVNALLYSFEGNAPMMFHSFLASIPILGWEIGGTEGLAYMFFGTTTMTAIYSAGTARAINAAIDHGENGTFGRRDVFNIGANVTALVLSFVTLKGIENNAAVIVAKGNPTSNINIVESNGIQFLEKILPDGRGIRLNMDGTFKGFIDQIR